MMYMWNYSLCQFCKRRTCSIGQMICSTCMREMEQRQHTRRKLRLPLWR